MERTQEKMSNSYKFKLVNCYLITYKIFNPSSDSASHQLNDPEITGWLTKMEVETDLDKRKEYAENIQRKLFDGTDALLPHIPMMYAKLTYTHSASLKNAAYNSLQDWYWAGTYMAE